MGKKTGLPKKAVQSVLNSFFQKEAGMIEMISHSFIPSEMKIRAAATVRDRMKASKIMK
ncbi:MAG: hypothetical protein JEY99_09395 [Spirochaetales bacterium]|nr:hypothetical protein [Spirochaetales bacterium]